MLNSKRACYEEHASVLAGVGAFEVGVDGLCEGSRHRQSVLEPHGERTGTSGGACRENTHTHTHTHTHTYIFKLLFLYTFS